MAHGLEACHTSGPNPDFGRRMEAGLERKNLERFGELVLADRALHGRLRATPDHAAFVALAVQLGAERGCEFSTATVEAALRECRRAWLERWL